MSSHALALESLCTRISTLKSVKLGSQKQLLSRKVGWPSFWLDRSLHSVSAPLVAASTDDAAKAAIKEKNRIALEKRRASLKVNSFSPVPTGC